jgi:tetratricopeptide (TPR) repeat protein
LKKAQVITIATGLVLVAALYFLGRTKPLASEKKTSAATSVSDDLTIDSILVHAKELLHPDQVTWLRTLEQSVVRGDVKNQQLNVYHQLAHFWKDTANIFEPYAWYEAEAARLELSEKSLTFAAHLFLENLRSENNPRLKRWKAFQAKDLFERSLKINDKNDSSLVGLGACYIFGGISETPMEGITKVRQVADRDSTNIFSQIVLGHGSLLSGQYDKAIDRFERVVRLEPGNLEALLILAEDFERKGDKASAVNWYTRALPLVQNPELKSAMQMRIEELSK